MFSQINLIVSIYYCSLIIHLSNSLIISGFGFFLFVSKEMLKKNQNISSAETNNFVANLFYLHIFWFDLSYKRLSEKFIAHLVLKLDLRSSHFSFILHIFCNNYRTMFQIIIDCTQPFTSSLPVNTESQIMCIILYIVNFLLVLLSGSCFMLHKYLKSNSKN